jgi:hypothetical protein
MRLVEIAGLINHIQDACTAPKQVSRVPSPLYLSKTVPSQSGELQEAALDRPQAQVRLAAADHAFDHGVAADGAADGQRRHERFGIVVGRRFPPAAIEPKPSVRLAWQHQAPMVEQGAGREPRQMRPETQPDAEPFAPGRAVDHRGPGHRAAQDNLG